MATPSFVAQQLGLIRALRQGRVDVIFAGQRVNRAVLEQARRTLAAVRYQRETLRRYQVRWPEA